MKVFKTTQNRPYMHPVAASMTTPKIDQEAWKQELLCSLSSVEDLAREGLVTQQEAQRMRQIGRKFKVRITPYYAKLIENRADCPIRQQAIPSFLEEDPLLPDWAVQLSQEIYQRPVPWSADAIGDIEHLATPRLTHRYENRAILHLSSMCAMYCRFCFRKTHLNDEGRTLYDGSLDTAIEYLRNTSAIREVILTGGDPLSLPDVTLRKLFEKISRISHIRMIRIHSRMGVTLPSRLTVGLADLFSERRSLSVTLVNHFNHPKELTGDALAAIRRMKRSGVTLLNQSVLLEGVNASTSCLAELFQKLFEAGVIPYYLHYPDWTPGTFHFRSGIEKARELMEELRGVVSGPALPDLILDVPQGYGKISLLNRQIQKIQDFPVEKVGERKIGGALYQVPLPSTLKGGKNLHKYLDCFVAGTRTLC